MKKYLILLVFLLWLPLGFCGQVNSEKGSYSIGWTELKIGGSGFNLELQRTYNSLSTHMGLFGYGWRTNLQSEFEMLPNGFIKIWDGAGFGTVFKPEKLSEAVKKELAKAVLKKLPQSEQTSSNEEKLKTNSEFLQQKLNEIVIDTVVKKFPTDKQTDMKAKITQSSVLRERWANLFGVSVFKFPLDTTFESNDRGPEKLEYKNFTVRVGSTLKTEPGYVRTFLVTGQKQFFDNSGRLIREQDVSGNYLSYSYVDNHTHKYKVEMIKNKIGQFIKLKYNKQGFISEASSSDGNKVTYKYSEKNHLMESVDAAKNKFIYEYDENYNLTRVKHPEAEELMAYFPDNRLKSYEVKGTGLITSYSYWPEKDVGTAMHNKTTIKRTYKSGDYQSSQIVSFERWYGVRENLTPYLKKQKIVRGNETEETEFSECCGKPLSIVKTIQDPTTRKPTSVVKASFKYDTLGRLVEKVQPDGEVVALTYHEGKLNHKVKRVVRGNLDLQFEYNEGGDVKTATKLEKIGDLTQKTTIFINYDARGRVKTITDKGDKEAVRVVTFEHNASGQPIKIGLQGIGEIFVQYDANGKIVDIKSKKGQEVAVKVTEAFTKLLNILEHAGVNLSL